LIEAGSFLRFPDGPARALKAHRPKPCCAFLSNMFVLKSTDVSGKSRREWIGVPFSGGAAEAAEKHASSCKEPVLKRRRSHDSVFAIRLLTRSIISTFPQVVKTNVESFALEAMAAVL